MNVMNVISEPRHYTSQEMRQVAGILEDAAHVYDTDIYITVDVPDGKSVTYSDSEIGAMLRQAADAEEELTKLKTRLDSVRMECDREISLRRSRLALCAKCYEDSSAGEDCPYNGEPNGCNSPVYGKYPVDKECEPFERILILC